MCWQNLESPCLVPVIPGERQEKGLYRLFIRILGILGNPQPQKNRFSLSHDTSLPPGCEHSQLCQMTTCDFVHIQLLPSSSHASHQTKTTRCGRSRFLWEIYLRPQLLKQKSSKHGIIFGAELASMNDDTLLTYRQTSGSICFLRARNLFYL